MTDLLQAVEDEPLSVIFDASDNCTDLYKTNELTDISRFVMFREIGSVVYLEFDSRSEFDLDADIPLLDSSLLRTRLEEKAVKP